MEQEKLQSRSWSLRRFLFVESFVGADGGEVSSSPEREATEDEGEAEAEGGASKWSEVLQVLQLLLTDQLQLPLLQSLGQGRAEEEAEQDRGRDEEGGGPGGHRDLQHPHTLRQLDCGQHWDRQRADGG